MKLIGADVYVLALRASLYGDEAIGAVAVVNLHVWAMVARSGGYRG